jgi:hypothetical protein
MLFSCRRQKRKYVHEPLCKLFRQNDQFEETILNEVDNPDLIPEFKNYKVDKEKNTVSRMSLHFLLQTQQYLMHEKLKT